MAVRQAAGYELVSQMLGADQCVVLDGGIATELPHQHGQDHEHLWGLEALASAPEEVLDVHRRYVRSGVNVVTTNTWALPTVLQGDGSVEDEHQRRLHWTEIAQRGVGVAREAIREAGREGEVAVAFSLNGDLDGPDGPDSVALLARKLAADPPDLILLETLSVLRPSLFEVMSALLGTSIPLWVSFRRCQHGLCGVYGQHWGGPEGDAFGKAARRFEDMGVAALLVNCIPPDHVQGMVSYLRDFTDMPLGVYPNLGYYTSAGWHTESEIGGADYAEMALHWRAEGAQIIGGCCGTRPEHLAAASEALTGTLPGNRRQAAELSTEAAPEGTDIPASSWSDRRGRKLYPISFPILAEHDDVPSAVPGRYLMWRHLLEEGVGAHQRCLDLGCGTGLQTVQLALNGAVHVHAIDVDARAVSNTLDNAFRNGVADRVTADVADIYPWLPQERYEVIVASLPQRPSDPLADPYSHRPTDYWGRGLIDQVITKLPRALAAEGRALITTTSLLSKAMTTRLLEQNGLVAEVAGWEVQDLPERYLTQPEHLAAVERVSDGYTVRVGDRPALVTYLLRIQHAAGARPAPDSPWGRQL